VASGAAGRRRHGALADGERQDEALVVVGVLADQVDPARRGPYDVRCPAVAGGEAGDGLLGDGSHERYGSPSAAACLAFSDNRREGVQAAPLAAAQQAVADVA